MLIKPIFNPRGKDSIITRQLVGGNSTNLINLNSVKYRWAAAIYEKMLENFWIPEKTDMTADKPDYQVLTPEERRAYDGILSFLIFLDSVQVNNLAYLNGFITAPELNVALAIQAQQEAVHVKSYQYIIESILPSEKREYIYDYWREDSILFERNQYIASLYQDFITSPNESNFLKSLVADFLLEGVYFYAGFQFFHLLYSRNLMGRTDDIIILIQRDENLHAALFSHILIEVANQFKLDLKELVYPLMREAAAQEVRWVNHIIGNQILGMNSASLVHYIYYICNSRLQLLKLEPLFDRVRNPFLHLDRDDDGSQDRQNVFETTTTNYSLPTAIGGWDEF